MPEHTEACILPRPGDSSCEQVREQYGLCPDHDGLCVGDCPVTGGGVQIYTEEPTDLDQITDHPFRPHPLHPEVCGYQRRDGWACGYLEAEHAARLEGATKGGDAIEQP